MNGLPIRRCMFGIAAAMLIFVAGVFQKIHAQVPDGEYYVSEYFTDESRPMIEPDSSLFYRAIQSSDDAFAVITDYDLSFVASSRRGMGYESHRVVLNGIPLQPAYRSALNYMNVTCRRYSGAAVASTTPGGMNGVTEYRTDFSEPVGMRSVGINVTDRVYLFGVRASAVETLGKGWTLSAMLSARTGRDMHVAGLFSSSATAGISTSKSWGERHRLSLTAMFAPSERSSRYSTTMEAFALTGDNLYNPSWGYQDGKVRSANVRRTFVPTVVVSYDLSVSDLTEVSLSLGVDAGHRRYSALAWFDARTPMPDNYHYMPSYFTDSEVAAEVAAAWRNNDARYTQINWGKLHEINDMSDDGHSAYAVEDRVERIADVNFRAAGRTVAGRRLTVGYGLNASYSNRRSYKQMRDLLGGDHIIDIDQYLVDDDMVGNMKQNDLRNPDRVIREGDRYGYDYALVRRYAGAFVTAEWRSDRLRFDLAAEIGEMAVFRRGYYEKELFAGSASYGRSRRVKMSPYTVKTVSGYSFTPRHYIGVTLAVAGSAPDSEDLFLQTQYNNRTIDSPKLETAFSAEVDYRYRGRAVNVSASLYLRRTWDGVDVAHYYDDLAFTYSDMVVSDIGLLNAGIEIAADVRFARNWSASVAASAGRYLYASDPRVTLYSDRDNSLICDRAVAHMGDCHVGGSPEAVVTADVVYMNRGWGARITGTYAGLRYVVPAVMRRTDRVSRQGSVSEEIFRRFVVQERMPDAVSVDAAVWKSFRLGNASRLVVSLSVRNLLGSRNIIYNGRESLRISRTNVEGEYLYEPFATRYTYSYPRSFYLSVNYKF